MSEFKKYRGDGTTRDGRQISTPDEEGRYLASPDLVHAVNAALAVKQPLLITGEAGTGKTMLAWSIAGELELGEVEVFNVRSDHQGRDLLYEIDNLQRFYDIQAQEPKARDRANYLQRGPLGRAFASDTQRLVLIDEIDKAPRDFPNDLLHAIDKMELRVPELNLAEKAIHRPVVVITSNRESQLPDPFLRRCVFHHIEFPNPDQLRSILSERLGHLQIAETLRGRIVDRFLEVRKTDGLLKKPATSEMLTWARVLHAAEVGEGELVKEKGLRDLPYLNALIKTREDMARVKPSAV